MFREDARRVIGATAKPLYPIDGKAAGFDRRNPKTSLFEGGGPPAAVEGVRGRWKESAAVEGVHHALPKIQLLHFICFICFSCLVCPKHMMFLFKNHQVSFRRMSRSSACFFSSNQRILKSESARNFRKTPIYEISNQKEPIFFQENRLLCFICFICFLCLVCLLCVGK